MKVAQKGCVIFASKNEEFPIGSCKPMENTGWRRGAAEEGGEICPVSVYCIEGPKISK
jgi:hypothetical protein